MTHWKRPWCWEGLGAGGEGNDRGWDGWMASPTRWAWVCVNSGSWWWTGRPGVLRFMGSQSWTRLSDWTELKNKWCWAPFHMSISHLYVFIGEVSLGLLPTFSLGCLLFCYWVISAACIFWKLILCQLSHLPLFSPILKLAFHLVYSFLCCEKAFKFNYVLLVYFCFYFHYSRKCVRGFLLWFMS